jgi:hypothetical protein
MRKLKIRISDTADVEDAIAAFQKRCDSLNLNDSVNVIQDVREVAYDLERRGKELASLGSQFTTVKVLTLPSCTVSIAAAYGVPHHKSPLAWLCSFFGSR